MQLNDVRDQRPSYHWDFEPKRINPNLTDLTCPEVVCGIFKPKACVNLRDYHCLNEATYKELAQLIDPSFLSQAQRKAKLTGIRAIGFEPENTLNFNVNSSEYDKNRIRYVNSVLFDEWEQIGTDQELSHIERARMLLWVGNIRLHCTCPAFLYWGFQYMLSVLDSAIYPEQRFPAQRNPKERGIVCKHMARVLEVLPFHSGDIAREIRRQFG